MVSKLSQNTFRPLDVGFGSFQNFDAKVSDEK